MHYQRQDSLLPASITVRHQTYLTFSMGMLATTTAIHIIVQHTHTAYQSTNKDISVTTVGFTAQIPSDISPSLAPDRRTQSPGMKAPHPRT